MKIQLFLTILIYLAQSMVARDISLANALPPEEQSNLRTENGIVATDTRLLRAAMRGESSLPLAKSANRDLLIIPVQEVAKNSRIRVVGNGEVKSKWEAVRNRVAKGYTKRDPFAVQAPKKVVAKTFFKRKLKGLGLRKRRLVKGGYSSVSQTGNKRKLKKLRLATKDDYGDEQKQTFVVKKMKLGWKQRQRGRTLVEASVPVLAQAKLVLDDTSELTKKEFFESDVVSTSVETRLKAASFDFVVGGFPKCGTTTLLKAFGLHPEIDIAATEQCSIASPGQADVVVLRKLDDTLADLSLDPSVKRSFKCPTAMYNYKSIVRMKKHSPNAKFVIGIRHPIKMLQSFYNYRVTEIYERNLVDHEPIPGFTELIDSGLQWKGVSSASVRFELFLTQLGKTTVTPEDMLELSKQNYDLAIKPSNFTVFLYSVDQLEDTNETRAENVRKALQDYLELDTSILPFGHENKNHAVGATGHKESIDICDEKYEAMRTRMIAQGSKSASWISEHFIASQDVVVANKEHFVATLKSWSKDPCGGALQSS